MSEMDIICMHKFLEKRLEQITKTPHVMVTHEKHGIRIWDASSCESIFKSCLDLLEERAETGWVSKPDEQYIQRYKPDLTKDQADALPEGTIKLEALKQIKTYSVKKKRLRQEKEEWDEIQKALKNEDGALAFMILDTRRDHEYENFTFEPLENAQKENEKDIPV
jgi:hypothetical protein